MADNRRIVVNPPLAGEWVAARSPGSRVPSHGTRLLATTYAFDFIKPGPSQSPFALLAFCVRGLFGGHPLSDYPSWGERVLSPFAGTVATAVDGVAEPDRTRLLHDLSRARRLAAGFARGESDDTASFAGNHVVLDRGTACSRRCAT